MSKGKEYITVLDIGSSKVKTVIAHLIPNEKPRIVGVGVANSNGMRKGVVIDIEEVTASIAESIEEAEKNSGVRVEKVFVSVGGNHISSVETKGVIVVGRADGEVEPEDVERAIEAAQAVSLTPNEEILHIIPRDFKLDSQEGIKDPIGMNGIRLEMNGILILGSSSHLRNLIKCIENNGINVSGFIASPLASAKAVLNKRQKELGVAMLDIGGQTTSLAVYEERQLIHIKVFPVGANHITNDLAICLRTSTEVAEKVKINFGSAFSKEISKKEQINLSEIDENEEVVVSRHQVAEIIEARIEEIFNLVERELKKIGRSALLPAGVVLTGGGACLPGMVDLAKDILKLPAQTGFPLELTGLIDKVDNPSFSVPIGMILWILEDNLVKQGSFASKKNKEKIKVDKEKFKQIINQAKKWLNRFLP